MTKSKPFEHKGLIGAGLYGCVYKPPLKCIDMPKLNKKYNKDIMKFAVDDPYANAEKYISSIIRDIDPKQEYFIPLSKDQCKVDIKREKKQVDKCEKYKDDDTLNKDKYIGFFIRYGGIALDKYIDLNGIDLDNIFKFMLHTYKGLSILHKNNIVHRDLSTSNIVISSDNIARIIDFGQATIVDKYNKYYKEDIYEDIKLLMEVFWDIRIEHGDEFEKKNKVLDENFIKLMDEIMDDSNVYKITIEYIMEYINKHIIPLIKK